MRFLLVSLLLLVGIAAVLTRGDWLPAPEPGATTPTPQPPSDQPVVGAAQVVGRSPAASSNASIAGTVVDATRRPIADARVFVVLGTEPLPPGVATDGQGHFTLFAVPPGPVAIRVEAARRETIQLGDLFAERAEGSHLELGELTMREAATWHGFVRARGRPIAGAEVTLLPQLGEPGTPTPLVQRATTDADGTFLFVAGLVPPCTVRVEATGHRTELRSIEHPQERLDFELVPQPRVRGRVVGSDGSPLPNARVFVRTIHHGEQSQAIGANPDLDPSLTHAVDANAAFDLPAPEGAWLVVQAMAPDRVTVATAPFPFADELQPLTLVLAPGCRVHGTVTWRGDPIHAMAQLWSVPAAKAPQHTVSVGGDGRLLMPAVPPGRYRLVVAAEQGAFLERELDLVGADDAALALALPEGTRLVGTVNGERPAAAAVVCTHDNGLRRRGLVRADGTYVVEGLGPGRWRADVVANPEDYRSQCDTLLTALLDEPGVVVGQQAELEHTVAAASLRLGSLRGTLAPQFARARLELVPGNGAQQRIPAGLRQVAVGDDGRLTLAPVLPGTWLVRLEPADGTAALERTVVVVAGAPTEVVFP
ncbi:MAG: carboxypeptidase regulatory-like domain-containing protein [Planctomycetes bacterium]|nr:carboxypeptidase regulatory-like domain-containing protein [Planctomycetota bacterium]